MLLLPKRKIFKYFQSKKIKHLRLFIVVLILVIYIPILQILVKIKAANDQSPAISVQKVLDYQHPPLPQLKTTTVPPVLATSYIVIDNASNTQIIAKNPNLKIYPASTTKLATALTALNVYPLDEVITINEPYKDGKIMELQSGEKITVRSLASALLIYSANDSAHALASHYSSGSFGFVNEMNRLMAKYQLKNTHFINVDGIHDPGHFSTVYDLSQLGRLAIKSPIVRELVKTKYLQVTDITSTIIHPMQSTNELLDIVPEIQGLKTGWTPEAGGCFVGLINLDGHELISVVANSTDRFGDTATLISWLKSNLEWNSYQLPDSTSSSNAGK